MMHAHRAIDSLSQELREIEPFWARCLPCRNSGRCCKGCDVPVYGSEWAAIIDFLTANPSVMEHAKEAFAAGRMCMFRGAQGCMIHDVRPLNCRYAPYSVGEGCFAPMDAHCSGFCRMDIKAVEKSMHENIVKVTFRSGKSLHYIDLASVGGIRDFLKENRDPLLMSRLFSDRI